MAQLTGRSANLFLLDSAGKITQAWRTPKGEGQQSGDALPAAVAGETLRLQPSPRKLARVDRYAATSPTISEAADKHYRALEAEHEFDSLAGKLAAKLRKEMNKRKKLQANLQKDLSRTAILTNTNDWAICCSPIIATANAYGNKVSLTDYYAEGAPTIEIEVDEKHTLQEAAAESFSRYTKAKRAVEEIGAQIAQLDRELEELEEKRMKLEEAIASRDADGSG